MARGIDTAAHQGALATGTVAVLGGGVDVVYPPENAVLAQEIGEAGLLLSEQPMGLVPQARHFPRRNRIISGLCRAVVVVEAAANSGSLVTARAALDQGREVMAVPGHPFDSRASGCNMLIRDGGLLIRSAEDVLAALAGPLAARPRPAPEPEIAVLPETRTLAETSALHRQILDRLGPSPLAEDQLIRDLNLPAGSIGPELLHLELDGRIERRPGGLLSRVQ
jgi:DNA processing protein